MNLLTFYYKTYLFAKLLEFVATDNNQGEIIRGDFDEERKDRERMASEMEELREAYSRLKQKLSMATKEVNAEREQRVYMEHQFKKLCEESDMTLHEYESEIRALTEENESLKNKGLHHAEGNVEDRVYTELKKLTQHSDQLQLNLGIVQSEKESLEKEVELLRLSHQEEKRKTRGNKGDSGLEIEEIKKRYEQKTKELIKQLKSQDLLRRIIKEQLDEETQKRNEMEEDFQMLLNELSAKKDIISMHQKELDMMHDKLKEVELSNSQLKCDLQTLNLNNLKLEDEISHYRMLNMAGSSQNKGLSNYSRLELEMKELKMQMELYQAKYSSLMNDYLELRQVAVQNGLHIPPRSGSPHPSHPEPTFHPSECDSHKHSRRTRKGYFKTENELLVDIDDDIQRAARDMEERQIDFDEEEDDDPRPFDDNLICPLCGKQFRIGQIQKFRHHVDNCVT